MAATRLPTRKPGVRRNRQTKVLTGGDTPSVSPAQDPGVRAIPGAFDLGGEGLQATGQDLTNLAIQKQDADDRIKAAEARRNAKHDNNISVRLVGEFEDDEEKFFNTLVTDNVLGAVDFNEKYSNEMDKLVAAKLENAKFSSPEAKIDFQGKLLEARLKLGDDRSLKNTTKTEEIQIGLARTKLRKYQLSQDRVGEGFSEVIAGAKTELAREFGDLLSESSEDILINEVVINQFEPQFTAFLAAGEANSARTLLEHPNVSGVLNPQQWRGEQQRIQLLENKITERLIEDNIKLSAAEKRLGIPASQFTPTQRQDALDNIDITRKGRELRAKAQIINKLDSPDEVTTEMMEAAARIDSGSPDPDKAFRDALSKDTAKSINFLRGEGRQIAESNLQAANLGQAALLATNEKGGRAFEPGTLPNLRTAISKAFKLFGFSQAAIDGLKFKLGNASVSDLQGRALSQLALSRAGELSRVTNMSLTMVREVFGERSSTPEGMAVVLNIAAIVSTMQLDLAELADDAAIRIEGGESKQDVLKEYRAKKEEIRKGAEITPEALEAMFIEFGVTPPKEGKKVPEAPEAPGVKLSKEDRAQVGKPFAQGSKIVGFEGADRVVIEKADGTQSTVPRSAIESFNNKSKKKSEAVKPKPKKEEEESRTGKQFFDDIVKDIKSFFGGGDESSPEKAILETMEKMNAKQEDLQKRTSEFLKLRPKDQSPEIQKQLNDESAANSIESKKLLKQFETLKGKKK